MNFVFWGLFLVLGLIVVGYVAWMVRLEQREEGRAAPRQPPEAS